MKRLLSIVFGLAFSFVGVLHFKNEANFTRIVPDIYHLNEQLL